MTKGYLRSTIGFLAAALVVLLLTTQTVLADNVYAALHGVATDVTGAIVVGADGRPALRSELRWYR